MSGANPADGEGRNLRIPPLLHVAAVAIAIVLGVIWYIDETRLSAVFGSFTAVGVLYTAFYARRSINLGEVRHNEALSLQDIHHEAVINAQQEHHNAVLAAQLEQHHAVMLAENARRSADIQLSCKAKTIEFSMTFSSSPVAEARAHMSTLWQSLKNDYEGNDDDANAVNANEDFSQTTVDAFEMKELGESDPESEQLVIYTRTILDFFEDLSVGLKQDVFDNEVAQELLGSPLRQFWDAFANFIKKDRIKRKQSSAYKHMEELRDRWK